MHPSRSRPGLASLVFVSFSFVGPLSPAHAETTVDPVARVEAALASANSFGASHILYAYAGAMRASGDVKRSQADALKAAEAALAKLKQGVAFEEVAKAESDCPSRAKGGSLGIFQGSVMHPLFEAALRKLKVGETSGVVETSFGYHVIRRESIDTEIHVAHILFSYAKAARAKETVKRSKDEARVAAQTALASLKSGAAFAELAKAQSDCPSNARGGDLGTFGKGVMAKAFEEAAFKLQVGELSDVVETPFGFHVLKRLPPQAE